MSEFWSRFVQQIINRGRLDKVTVYSLNGTKLVSSPNCDLWEAQVQGIIAALNGPNVTMFKLALGDKDFKCLKARSDTLIGRELANKELVVVHQIGDAVIIGFGEVDGAGSCIYEVQQLYLDIKQGDLIHLEEGLGDGQMTSADQSSNALELTEVDHLFAINNNESISLEILRKMIK